MDENNYRATYREINDLPCVFEKAILQQCCQCHLTQHINLAERIGVACTDADSQNRCRKFLLHMHEKSVFALQIPNKQSGQLPHAKEIKIQCGGVNGLHELGGGNSETKDIDLLLEQLLQQYAQLEELPYDLIIRSVVQFEGRKRRRDK